MSFRKLLCASLIFAAAAYVLNATQKKVVFVAFDGWAAKGFEQAEMPNIKKVYANGDKFFWAPQILKKDGRYVLAYCSSIETDKGRKHFMSVAESDKPHGIFSKSKVLTSDERVEIDPFIFTDDDGRTYVYYSRGNGNGICGRELTQNLDDKKLGYKTLVKNDRPWEGKVMPAHYWELNKNIPAKSDKFNCNKITVEGPTVLKRGGKYVMFYSANDFRSPDYCIGVAVADSPLGEFKKIQDYPMISREITGFNGSGHGDVFFDKTAKCGMSSTSTIPISASRRAHRHNQACRDFRFKRHSALQGTLRHYETFVKKPYK